MPKQKKPDPTEVPGEYDMSRAERKREAYQRHDREMAETLRAAQARDALIAAGWAPIKGGRA